MIKSVNQYKETTLKGSNKAIKEAREKMHTSINLNGKLSPITIKLSQELDMLIAIEQRRRMRDWRIQRD